MKVASGPCQAAHLSPTAIPSKLAFFFFFFNLSSQRRCWHESEAVPVDLPMHGQAFLYFMKISLAWLQDRCLWQPHPTGQGSLGSSKCPGMQVLLLGPAKLLDGHEQKEKK